MCRPTGFALVELRVLVAIVAILTVFGLPAHNDYVRRSQLQETFANLSGFGIRMEQYCQDDRIHANAGACGAAHPAAAAARYANYACALDTTAGAAPGQSHTMTATGTGNLAGFVLTSNERNVRATTAMPAAWGALPADAGTLWIDRRP